MKLIWLRSSKLIEIIITNIDGMYAFKYIWKIPFWDSPYMAPPIPLLIPRHRLPTTSPVNASTDHCHHHHHHCSWKSCEHGLGSGSGGGVCPSKHHADMKGAAYKPSRNFALVPRHFFEVNLKYKWKTHLSEILTLSHRPHLFSIPWHAFPATSPAVATGQFSFGTCIAWGKMALDY